jgi:hypothetical protein
MSEKHIGHQIAEQFKQRCDDRRQEEREQRMPSVHSLKTWPEMFQHVWTGAKPFEYRQDDRDYQVGDLLLLREYSPVCVTCGSASPGTCDDGCTPEGYLNRVIMARATFVMRHSHWKLQPGYCIIGIRVLDTFKSDRTCDPSALPDDFFVRFYDQPPTCPGREHRSDACDTCNAKPYERCGR